MHHIVCIIFCFNKYVYKYLLKKPPTSMLNNWKYLVFWNSRPQLMTDLKKSCSLPFRRALFSLKGISLRFIPQVIVFNLDLLESFHILPNNPKTNMLEQNLSKLYNEKEIQISILKFLVGQCPDYFCNSFKLWNKPWINSSTFEKILLWTSVCFSMTE